MILSNFSYLTGTKVVKASETNATELFISEYVEGSSHNKAIEIYNGTGAQVDLTEYSLKKDVNGKDKFGDECKLKGKLGNGQVYVVANSGASKEIKDKADEFSGVCNFNGNDQVMLLKNDKEIDRIGISGGENFGKDHTYIRKESVCSPKSGEQDPRSNGEWKELSKNYIENLGVHTMETGAVQQVPKVTANPAPGAVNAGTEITLSTTTQAAIYFTIDETKPTENSELYSENNKPVVDKSPTIIKAVAIRDGLEDSDIATFEYNILKLSSISEVREKNNSPAIIEGVVTAKLGTDIYIQDDTAGIIVNTYKLDGIDSINIELGDKVHVEGKIEIYKEMSQIKPDSVQDVSIIQKAVGVPNPIIIAPNENTNDVEGRLIKIENVKVLSKDEYGNYTVVDVNDVNNQTLVKPKKSNWLEIGQVYESIVGVSKYNYGQKIFTRTIGDIVQDNSKVIKVTASPNGGDVEKGQIVKLSTRTEGAAIHYTIDGSDPTEQSTLYNDNEGITINEDISLKAIAVKNGLNNSDIVTFEYKIGQLTKIRDIQGKGHTSPLEGKEVNNIRGVVTAAENKGFYMQDPNPDSDNKTSEGIYVYMKNHGASVGDLVFVDGEVSEYGYNGKLSVTQLKAVRVTKISSENKLPTPIVIGEGGRTPSTTIIDNDKFAEFDPEEDAIDFYESLEGMLVQVNDPLVVGVTEKHGEIVVLADNGEASEAKKTINNGITAAVDNFNPERIMVDDVIIPITDNENKKFIDSRFNTIKVGDKFNNSIKGVMDYGYGNYKLFNTEKLPDFIEGENRREATTIVPSEEKLTVVSYNIENFSAVTGTDKVNKIANSIVNQLKKPDIIGLIEVQDNNGAKKSKKGEEPEKDGVVDASQTYKTLINAIKANGGPEYGFTDIAPNDGEDGGQPTGNIRVGYIYRTDRVSLVDKSKGDATTAVHMDGKDLSLNPGRIDPTNSAFEGSRKSLAAEFEFYGEKVFVIANHFCSKRGDDGLFGSNQPPVRGSEVERHKQAAVINNFADEILAAEPNANIVVLGDMNDFEFSETLSILKGKGKENILTNMIDELSKSERFTYVYRGNSQVLDNVLVSNKLRTKTEVDVVNINSEFVDGYGRASDHDPVMIQITMLGEEDSVTKAIAAIDALPEVSKLTLNHKSAVENARALVEAALKLGAAEAEITNLSKLKAVEAKMEELKNAGKLVAVKEAISAIKALPEVDKLTSDHKKVVQDARVLVNKAIELGAEESDITNLSILEAAEAKIDSLDPNAPYGWNNEIPEKKPSQEKDNGKLVLFDNSHMETVGNADWVLDGGFSDFADDLVEEGYTVREYRGVDKNNDGIIRFYDDRKEENVDKNEAIITFDAIKDSEVFVIAEANRPFTKAEQDALVEYVESGKGIYFISDHYNADRNKNTWDATEVYNGYNRSDLDKFNIGGVYGDWRNPKDASKGWLSEKFGLRFRFNCMNWKQGVSGLKTDIDTEGILNGVEPVLMAAGGTIAITNEDIAKGLIYFGESDNPSKWNHSVDKGIYFGGEKEGAFVAISKPSKGKAAFIGDSSPIEDSTPKYLREDNGKKAKTYPGWNSKGNAAKLSINIVNWLATTEDYVGFDGTNHKKGFVTQEPIADIEKVDPDNGQPWQQPGGGFDPWNTDTWANGAYGAPHGTNGGSSGGDTGGETEGSVQLKLYPNYVYENEPFALTVQGTIKGSEFGAYLVGGTQVGLVKKGNTWTTNAGYHDLWGEESPMTFTAKVISVEDSVSLRVRLSKKNKYTKSVVGISSGYGYIEGTVNGKEGEIVAALKGNEILGTAEIDSNKNVKIAVKSGDGISLALYGKDGVKKSDLNGKYTVTDEKTTSIKDGNVPEPTIKSVSPLSDINIEVGGDLILPKVVEVTMSDNTTKNAAVTWDKTNLDINKVGEYTLTGDIEGTELKAQIKIIVEDEISSDMPLNIKKVITTDMQGNEKDKFKLNSTVVVNTDIQNISDADVTGTVIIKIADSEKQTHYIGFVKNMLFPKEKTQQAALGFTMKDVKVGKYKAKVYVWDGIEDGYPLAKTGEKISEFEFEICN
jgi:predicted extracellular nuclease